MPEPTAKHQQEAREILRACEQRTGVFLGSGSELNDFVSHVAAALSARDVEIREVLEGLRMRSPDCWCDPAPVKEHAKPCLAARALYDKLNPDSTNEGGGS